MILRLAHEQLRWPSPGQILCPPGAGPSVYARLADAKLGQALRRSAGPDIQVGILAAEPTARATEAPLAIVCVFARPADPPMLYEAHRLAWSFSRSPLLITLEPHAIRAWTCCEPPQPNDRTASLPPEIREAKIDVGSDGSIPRQAAASLDWLDLVSGEFYRRYENRFNRNQCADQLLLENLKTVREKLKAQRLDYDITHDLLARLIFIQFLCDRTDSTGKPALGPAELHRLHERGELSERYANLAEILQNYADTYALFQWLNRIFNGDVFPGKGATEAQREAEWQAEKDRVKPEHLRTLADFVSGRMEMRRGQRCLWREYAFDIIPLEFISSIYEEFVSKRSDSTGAHYTPAHVVDFMLDRVLPWDGDKWDLKVLDPACGSGIFLVKAYQRLIHRWRNAHPGEEPKVAILRQLLNENLFGVDNDPHAVRVASFSLYLAMCDEIDPRHYWTQVRFPRLRGQRLIEADFFGESEPGFRTEGDAKHYDLVVGNAPWGNKTETPAAQNWKAAQGWTTAYRGIGPLFLPKAARLTKPGGQIAMLQPAGLLFQGVGPAREFRAKLFSQFKVDEVVNLAALRFGLFKGAVSPACIVSMCAMDPDGEPLLYMSPKPVLSNEDDYRVIIEPHDVHFIPPDEAAHDRHVWTALMWGGRRDLELVRRLSQHASLAQLEDQSNVKAREGIIRGNRRKRQEAILGRRILEQEAEFPQGAFFELRAADLPINRNPDVHSRDSTDFSAFELPQLIIKQSWKSERARFQASLVRFSPDGRGVICDQKYVSVSVPEALQSWLESAWLSYNSILAVYYLFLTSSRLGAYRPEPLVSEWLSVPLSKPRENLLADLTTFGDVDERVRKLFAFKPAEWTLIKDLVQYTFADFKGDASSPGRQPTRRGKEPDLKAYASAFAAVMKAGFGADKQVCATGFQEKNGRNLPVRMVAMHLGWPDANEFRVESLSQDRLRSRLEELNKKFLGTPIAREGGIFYQRVARVYDTVQYRGVKVPTVYLIKPDRLRYWTRSAAMRDADEVAADLMSWQHAAASPADVTAEQPIA